MSVYYTKQATMILKHTEKNLYETEDIQVNNPCVILHFVEFLRRKYLICLMVQRITHLNLYHVVRGMVVDV